jgi:hypothetical protein
MHLWANAGWRDRNSNGISVNADSRKEQRRAVLAIESAEKRIRIENKRLYRVITKEIPQGRPFQAERVIHLNGV